LATLLVFNNNKDSETVAVAYYYTHSYIVSCNLLSLSSESATTMSTFLFSSECVNEGHPGELYELLGVPPVVVCRLCLVVSVFVDCFILLSFLAPSPCNPSNPFAYDNILLTGLTHPLLHIVDQQPVPNIISFVPQILHPTILLLQQLRADKFCDQISDAVVDACLQGDEQSCVACECCCTTGMVMILGDLRTGLARYH